MKTSTLGWLALALGVLHTGSASAFTIETSVTQGCHEAVTEDILRNTRKALPAVAKPLPSAGEDKALIDDTPFTVPGDLNDIAAVTLLLGVRDNDIKSFAAQALDQLARLNADPASQKEHCLRLDTEDEPTGSAAALEHCRTFIRESLLSTLDGLDSAGLPDPAKREDLEVTLAIRGQVHVLVPMFYLRAGRALHTIEDSFTHTFRNVDDPRKVTAVLNWVDYANKKLDESRDGPAHMTELDRCDNPDPLRTERRRLAVEAGSKALAVLLAPGQDRAAKTRGIDALLTEYLTYDAASNCTPENQWCNAPELAYKPTGCGCRLAPAPSDRTPLTLTMIFPLLFVLRRRSRNARSLLRAAPALALAWALLAPRAAHAAEYVNAANTKPGTGGPINALEGKSNSGAPGKQDREGAFFGRVAFGASYDKPGFAGGLGVRYQLSRPFMLGFDTEINPWLALTPSRLRTGALNSYVSIIRRFQLKTDSLNVRSQLGLGVSVLLIDLVGAPAYSYGPFVGISFLGAEWKISPGFYLTIDPTYIAIPVPHLTGAPFAYTQYRFQLGLEFGG